MTYNPNSFEMAACFGGDAQAMLSTAFLSKNAEQFKFALSSGGDVQLEDAKTNLSIFNLICQTPDSAQFIKLCAEDGHCDVNKLNSKLQKRGIHFCAESLDPINFAELLNHKPNLDSQYETLTPLHQLCKFLTEENFTKVFDCVKMLVKHGCNVNIPDRKNITPIVLLVRSKVLGAEQIIRYMLDNSTVDLDKYRDGEARKLLAKKFPTLALPQKIDAVQPIDFNYLKGLLKEHKEDLFVDTLKTFMQNGELNTDNQNNLLHEDYGDGNLLQVAVREGLLLAVKSLVRSGGNAMQAKPKMYSPIALACLNGNWEILQYLVNVPGIKLKHHEPLITIVIKKLGELSKSRHCDYSKCFNILLTDNRLDINETDSLNCTPLHYAVRYKNEGAIKALLQKGAYIGVKNNFHDLPISDINPAILEEYFDSCIKTNELRPGDENYEIIFDYSSLVPDKVRLNDEDDDLDEKQMNYIMNRYAEEMLPIEYMTKTPELKRLIKHPLITSFLWLKWNRLGSIFYANFAAYSIFCVSMIMYLVFCYGHDFSEPAATILQCFCLFGAIYVTIRELIQVFMLSIGYFKLLENYLEMLLIGISFTVLLARDTPNEEFRRGLAAVAILLAATEFSMLVGSLPIMSISTHMVMLKTVSISFMRSLVLYSIIIVSFALCFYTLLGQQSEPNKVAVPSVINGTIVVEDKKEEEDDESFNKFDDPWTAIVKTIVMFTGEYDAASIKFGTNTPAYLIFVLFVFFISIVLLNLLNGLAVNDTAAIKAEAELTGYIYRVKLLSRYEKMMLGQTRHGKCSNFVIRNWLVQTFAGNIISLFPSYLPLNKIILMPNENRKVYILRQSNEFVEIHKPNEHIVRSSNSSLIEKVPLRPSNIPLLCCLCNNNCSQMDGKIFKYAQKVLENKKHLVEEEKEKKEFNRRLDRIEHSVDAILQMMQQIATNQSKQQN